MPRKKPPAAPRTPLSGESAPDSPQAGQTPPPPNEEDQFAGITQFPTWRTKGLTPLQQRFCQEYLVDLHATNAYLRANPDVQRDTARVEGSFLLTLPDICAEIQRLMNERAVRTGITVDRVLVKLWTLASADHRELVQVHVGCCRFCFGFLNKYQRTRAEFERDTLKHEQDELKREKANPKDFEPRQFDEQGGIGFNGNRKPNPDCPECFGDGEPRGVVADTRDFSEAASALYAGVKMKDGTVTEFKTQDQGAALERIGRHLGMWNEKLQGNASEVNPLMALIQQIAAQGRGATLQVVAQDPEQRTPQSAPGADLPIDVEAKVSTGAASKTKARAPDGSIEAKFKLPPSMLWKKNK